ncbi:P-loop containing nucleoside triphosphate hydrolase protein [Crepidotus variabilis]|uniref:P-loop containing nucleoside triphosphate hydrolase protein n=1 Tax=Crepidotus variabilis TaxID=179855 RepID=A0A9P6EJT8_9AGAR|nr:P-loop containing nucleoside triphosphate hydrolase protein [Crepidotus variabilis]
MNLVVGQAFDAFAKYPLTPNPPQCAKDALLRGVGMAAIELVGLAVGSLALGSLTSGLWIWTGEVNRNRQYPRCNFPLLWNAPPIPHNLLCRSHTRLPTIMGSDSRHLSAVPILIFIQALSQGFAAPLLSAECHQTGVSATIIEPAVSAITTVKAFNAAPLELTRASNSFTSLRDIATRLNGVWGFTSGLAQFVMMAIEGDVLSVFWACLIATSNLQMCIPGFIGLARGKGAMVSLMTLIQDAPGPANEGLRTSINSTTSGTVPPSPTKSAPFTSPRKASRTLRKITPSRCTSKLALHNVTFAYPARASIPVLQDVSLFLPANEMMFIVGSSGSRNSTVAQLLVGMYAIQAGSSGLTLDEQDVKYLNTEWIRKNVCVVGQSGGGVGGGTVIIEGLSLFDNIALAAGERYAQGLVPREEVGENEQGGIQLSGGQKQRLALARARVRNPSVLGLDEATSAPDATSQILVSEALKRWRKNKTTIVIMHDLSQIQTEDFTYVLKSGRVVEQGLRYNLEGTYEGMEGKDGGKGEFRKMMESQRLTGGFLPEKKVDTEVPASEEEDLELEDDTEEDAVVPSKLKHQSIAIRNPAPVVPYTARFSKPIPALTVAQDSVRVSRYVPTPLSPVGEAFSPIEMTQSLGGSKARKNHKQCTSYRADDSAYLSLQPVPLSPSPTVHPCEVRNKRTRESVARGYYNAIINIRGIRTMSFKRIFKKCFDDSAERALKTGVRGAFVEGCTYGVSSGLIYLAEAMLFYVGAVLISKGLFTYLQMVEVLNLVVFTVTIGSQLMAFTNKIAKSVQATDGLNKLLNLDTNTNESRGILTPTISSPIQFTYIQFAYPKRPEATILKDINFSVTEGECVAIVGSSGCGKPTIAALLQRLLERDEHSPSQGQRLGCQPTANLFYASIAENIWYGDKNITDVDIRIAAKAAHVHEFLVSLPQGYDTPIARALARSSRILILDECTSALDPENQAAVLETIQSAKQGRTTVMVTHKLDVMLMCDRILVVNDGEVAEQGTTQRTEVDGDELKDALSNPENGILPSLICSLTAHSRLAQDAMNTAAIFEAFCSLLLCQNVYVSLASLAQVGRLPEAVEVTANMENLLQQMLRFLAQSPMADDLKNKFTVTRTRVQDLLGDVYSRRIMVSLTAILIRPFIQVRGSQTTLQLKELLCSLAPSSLAHHLTTLRRDLLAFFVDHVLKQPYSIDAQSFSSDEMELSLVPAPSIEDAGKRLQDLSSQRGLGLDEPASAAFLEGSPYGRSFDDNVSTTDTSEGNAATAAESWGLDEPSTPITPNIPEADGWVFDNDMDTNPDSEPGLESDDAWSWNDEPADDGAENNNWDDP